MTSGKPTWKAWLRAWAIAIAMLVHGIYALPSPVAVAPKELATPEGVEELARWQGLLEGLGVEITSEELGIQTVAWTKRISDVHRSAKAPFRKWMRYTGTGQGWGLFASPDTYPHRLEVYVFQDKRWVPVFRRNHPTLDFLDGTLRFRRVRGIYDGSTTRQRVVYWNLARWVAKRALIAHPEATRARVQMVQQHTTVPWEEPDPAEVVRAKRVFKRSALLPDDGLAL